MLVMTDQAAPGDLELVRAFVNTIDVEDGTELLPDARAATRWLREHGLLDGEALSEAELERLAGLRHALRELLLANNLGEEAPAEALEALNREGADAALVLRFGPDGPETAADSRCSGLAAAVGRLLAIVAGAMRDGTWKRLKICPADDCRWAFYDHSRNHSGTWCSMGVCGNRAKARSYRERRRASK